jgi:hypothetical protein
MYTIVLSGKKNSSVVKEFDLESISLFRVGCRVITNPLGVKSMMSLHRSYVIFTLVSFLLNL